MRVLNWVQAVDKLTGFFEKPEIIHSVNTNRCEGGRAGQLETVMKNHMQADMHHFFLLHCSRM